MQPYNSELGDLCRRQKEAILLLKSSKMPQRNSTGRERDFKAELEWRLMLRETIRYDVMFC